MLTRAFYLSSAILNLNYAYVLSGSTRRRRYVGGDGVHDVVTGMLMMLKPLMRRHHCRDHGIRHGSTAVLLRHPHTLARRCGTTCRGQSGDRPLGGGSLAERTVGLARWV
jgi:hypothetical protein